MSRVLLPTTDFYALPCHNLGSPTVVSGGDNAEAIVTFKVDSAGNTFAKTILCDISCWKGLGPSQIAASTQLVVIGSLYYLCIFPKNSEACSFLDECPSQSAAREGTSSRHCNISQVISRKAVKLWSGAVNSFAQIQSPVQTESAITPFFR